MRISAWISMAIAMSVLAGPAATADPRNPNVNKRQELQRERLQRGVWPGKLTQREARELARERSDIKQQKHDTQQR
jgi:hypothetical protein